MTGRGWGLWSQIKLDVLNRYMHQFLQTTKNKSTERIYLDLFAGEPENFTRATGERVVGSASLALSQQNPSFTRIALFELEANAHALELDLRSKYPSSPFRVHAGDCNETLAGALDELKPVSWAPTFAFIDPDGPDCHWSTLELLASFKPSRSKTKVEFWLLFPTMFMRQLPLTGAPFRLEDAAQITRMYGIDQWKRIFEARRSDEIGPEQARGEYVNLMRWRIEQALGYRWTHPLEIPNERGNPIYTMILATDSEAGTRIMSSLYRHAAGQFPVMRMQSQRIRERKARDEAGTNSLFDVSGIEDFEVDPRNYPLGSYSHVPPVPPRGTFLAALPSG
jgi:three-Cys-motif partner protein